MTNTRDCLCIPQLHLNREGSDAILSSEGSDAILSSEGSDAIIRRVMISTRGC